MCIPHSVYLLLDILTSFYPPTLGEFGTVYRGIWKQQGGKAMAIAVKTLKVRRLSTGSLTPVGEVTQ